MRTIHAFHGETDADLIFWPKLCMKGEEREREREKKKEGRKKKKTEEEKVKGEEEEENPAKTL